MNYYIISKIEPKQSGMRNIHKAMIGCECNILRLNVNHSAWIRYYPENEMKYGRLAYTSAVEKIDINETGSITLYTRNTVYSFEMIRGSLKEIVEDAD